MTLTSSKIKLTSLSLLALILVLLVFWAIYQIRAENEETSRLLNTVNQAAQNELQAKAVRVLQDTALAEIEAFEDFALSDDRIVAVIENIESAGEALGLDTKIVSVEKIEEGSANEPQRIHLVIESLGSWGRNFSFIRAIENLPHRIFIEDVSLSKEETQWLSRIKLSLYSFN